MADHVICDESQKRDIVASGVCQRHHAIECKSCEVLFLLGKHDKINERCSLFTLCGVKSLIKFTLG